jgi:hypothetical protein
VDPFAVEKARPVLDPLGTETIHLGPSGSGAMPKLIDKFLYGAQVACAGRGDRRDQAQRPRRLQGLTRKTT